MVVYKDCCIALQGSEIEGCKVDICRNVLYGIYCMPNLYIGVRSCDAFDTYQQSSAESSTERFTSIIWYILRAWNFGSNFYIALAMFSSEPAKANIFSRMLESLYKLQSKQALYKAKTRSQIIIQGGLWQEIGDIRDLPNCTGFVFRSYCIQKL